MAKQESKTKSFILRIDSDTMAAIEKWAADEFRSTNGQLQWIINEALRKNGRLRTKKTSTKQNEQGDNE
ncbi:MAG: DNA-binding protein [Paraprevotella sp.]|nr:DNA-binding protein [Paraprevotella sp.]